MLSDEGVRSTSLSNPTLLMDTLDQAGHIDLVFLDLEMPNADGYEVLEQLKIELGSDIPVIACTVHTNEVNNARQQGFHSFIGKPLDVDRFPDQLQRILNRQRVWE